METNYYDEHYKNLPIEPIVLMKLTLTPEEFKGYLKGNIIKYCLRAGNKKGESYEKDITKLNRYKEWLSSLINRDTLNE